MLEEAADLFSMIKELSIISLEIDRMFRAETLYLSLDLSDLFQRLLSHLMNLESNRLSLPAEPKLSDSRGAKVNRSAGRPEHISYHGADLARSRSASMSTRLWARLKGTASYAPKTATQV